MPETSNTISNLRLVAIPRLAAGGRWRVEAMRSLAEPMLLWFTRGQGRITIAGMTRGYGPNNAIFIPAGTMHGFEVGQHVFGTAIFFGRDTDLTLPQKVQHLRVRESSAQVELNLILDSIGREQVSDKPAHDRATGHYLGLLSVWLERQIAVQPPEDLPHPESARKLASRFTQLLERDFRSGNGVAEYAAELGVTPTHLSRVCRTTTGRSAKAILSDRVLFEARRMLSDTKTPVQDVAKTLGFTSAAYFTRAFQHQTGKTPSDFRRLAAEEATQATAPKPGAAMAPRPPIGRAPVAPIGSRFR
ncbi:AraC family transcriptional regulator [Gemmobacter sp.]|uniref:AraC family transcriptional regulator n=1 Tax=Gemmobacter sp. TaxID=1898957 RepID=UPI002AFDEA73|nr:AraC family transcriptional regulator [Gemmobacter sp.]